MYYEIYIDQFFVEHLLTGYLLLELSALLAGWRIPWIRVAAGSLGNTAVVTAALAFLAAGGAEHDSFSQGMMLAAYGAGILVAGMAVFGRKGLYRQKGKVFFLLLVTVLLGSTVEALLRITGFSAGVCACLSSVLLRLVIKRKETYRWKAEHMAEVTIIREEKQVTLSGMIDTGNLLKEPLTGQPVSIAQKSSISLLLEAGWEEKSGFFLIPFHSIGTEKGWLQAIRADRMEVQIGERKTVISRPILALYEGNLSAGKEYQMILHQQHVNEERGE